MISSTKDVTGNDDVARSNEDTSSLSLFPYIFCKNVEMEEIWQFFEKNCEAKTYLILEKSYGERINLKIKKMKEVKIEGVKIGRGSRE